MTKRTMVSLPDELFEELEMYKNEMNVSGEFQKCIKREIEKRKIYSQKIKGATTMQGTIERLKKEKEESLCATKEWAKNEGLEWAGTASYDDLQFVLKNWGPEIESQKLNQFYSVPLPDKDFTEGEYLIEYFENDIFSQGGNLMGWDHEGFPAFVDEWMKGVEDFWNGIKDKI